MWKDLAVALSLANLCFFEMWMRLLSSAPNPVDALRTPPGPAEYLVAVFNVSVAGVALFAAMRLARWKLRGRVLEAACAAFCLSWLAPLYAVGSYWFGSQPVPWLPALVEALGRTKAVLAAAAAVVLMAALIVTWRRPLARAAYGFLLIVSPFLLFNFGSVGWRAVTENPVAADARAVAEGILKEEREPPRRVLWIVFDEWDYRLTFEERPADLELPEFDRFRAQALHATRAYPPGARTHLTMASLILGRVVADAEPDPPSGLLVSFADSGEAVPWSSHPNIFAKARRAGFHTAVVGWYMPYCPLLGDSLTRCWWNDRRPRRIQDTGDIPRLMSAQWGSVIERARFSALGRSLPALHHSQLYRQISVEVERVIADPSLGLTLLHLPVPHPPHFYDRFTGEFVTTGSQVSGYFDSLALADATLGWIRARMVEEGLWDDTTVLLTSDHWHRTSHLIDGKLDQRVPFLLKLARQRGPGRYDEPFNTVLAHDLLQAVLRGEIVRPRPVVAWLDRNRGRVEPVPIY